MMIGRIVLGLQLVLAGFSVSAAAAMAAQTPKYYRCEIRTIYQLTDGGALKPPNTGVAQLGERFQVNIKTGGISGSPLFDSSNWGATTVLDPGTSQQGSFVKILYTSPPGGDFLNVAFLQIEGTIEQPSRPFLFENGSLLYSGVCSAVF
jgi:hypothetical protein